jgi:FMN reductase
MTSAAGEPQASPRPGLLRLARGARVVGLVGNPKPGSRTHQMVSAVAEAFAAASGGAVATVIDLVDLKPWLFEWGRLEVTSTLAQVFAADVLVVGSPVYKATYTGLLKAFCDHIAQGQLAGILALPTMMGGAHQHALAVDHQLRPLLVELGATCATPGLYMLEAQLEDLANVAQEYVKRVGESIVLGA